MLHKDHKPDPCINRPDQFFFKPLMLLADVPAQLLQVLLSVNDEPGIIQTHIIPDQKLAGKMPDAVLVKCLNDLPDCPRLFPAVYLYIHYDHAPN